MLPPCIQHPCVSLYLWEAHCVTPDIDSVKKVVVNFTTFDDLDTIIAQDKKAYVHYSSFDQLQYAHARNIIKIIIHPDRIINTKPNDIALLFLDVPVPAITNVLYNDDPSIPTDYELLTTIGAGRTMFDGLLPHELMEVDLLKENDNNCSAASILFDPNIMLCAGASEGTSSACYGDSGMSHLEGCLVFHHKFDASFTNALTLHIFLHTGGPLIIKGDGPEKDILVGLTSFGSLICGYYEDPGVSTRVSAFHDWIVATLLCEGGDSCIPSPISSPINTPGQTMTPTFTSWPTVSLLGEVVSPVDLPGPTVMITVNLTTDSYPEETSLRYSDLCSGEMIEIVSGLKDNLSLETTFIYSITLSSGIYEIETYDYSWDGMS